MQKEAEQIHEASLKLLAEPGIKIDHQLIRERLGCRSVFFCG